MEVRILGPLEVWADGRQVDIGGGRQRALLALLVLHHGEVVSTDRLVDALWGSDPPRTAAKALQNLVSQLRRMLGPDLEGALVTRSPGYVLELVDDRIDAGRFERVMAEGQRLLEGDPETAARLLREALVLWRGEPLAEFAYEQFAQAEIARLHELRLAALESRIDADLRLGRHADLVPELETLVATHPLRERLRGQQMLALYGSGRQAEALEAYRNARVSLRHELGLEPSPWLRQLEQAILAQDPALGQPARVPARLVRGRRPALLVAAAVALTAAVAVGLGVLLRDPSSIEVLPDSVVKIDPSSNTVVDSVRVGAEPGLVRVLAGDVFVTSMRDRTLTRIDGRTGAVAVSGEHAAGPGVVTAGNHLWVGSEARGEVTRVNPDTLRALERIKLDVDPGDLLHALLALGAGSLWVSEVAPSAVTRWSLRTHRLIRRYELGVEFPVEITFGNGDAWVPLHLSDNLLRIDGRTGETRRMAVGLRPTNPVIGFGSVWVGSTGQGTVWRIDPIAERVERVIPVETVPFGLAVGAGSVWVSDACHGRVLRIDPTTNEIVARIGTRLLPRWLAFGAGHLWVGVAQKDTFDWKSSPLCRS